MQSCILGWCAVVGGVAKFTKQALRSWSARAASFSHNRVCCCQQVSQFAPWVWPAPRGGPHREVLSSLRFVAGYVAALLNALARSRLQSSGRNARVLRATAAAGALCQLARESALPESAAPTWQLHVLTSRLLGLVAWHKSKATARRRPKESMQARDQPTSQTTSTAGGRDTLPEWSKGVDSSSTSASCVGSNPTGVIVTQGPRSNGGAICCRSCDTAWLSKANPQIIHNQARGRD